MAIAEFQGLQTLINKRDTLEIVRDRIAQILACESLNQQKIALEAGDLDPRDWAFDTYLDRSNPFEKWLNEDGQGQAPGAKERRTPIVNVWFDQGQYDKGTGNMIECQTFSGNFNIDCYGLGMATDIHGGGHIPGDEASVIEAHRIMRLIRNILMAGPNRYLQMRGIVGNKWISNQSLFQPRFDNNQALQVSAGRIILNVDFLEFSPQYVGEILDGIDIDLKRAADGKVLAELDYTYTT